jgi:hypothetical protein
MSQEGEPMQLRLVCIRTMILLAAVALVFPAPGLNAQEARGSIVGKVMDASGGVIPGVTVEVLHKAMGTKTSLVTNEAGLYQASYLLSGIYQVTAELQGFKKYVRDDVELRVNDRLEIDIKLEVGGLSETVTITGETPLLESASASMGSVIDSRRVSELPIVHGNPYELIGLAGGVSFNRDMRLDRPFEPTHIVGYSMDGTRANRSDVTLDGAPSTATANAGEVIASYVPPADIVQEFKVQTATFDASFGQTEGGVTNISIKSGTNAFHGTAYWSTQRKAWFANDFFGNMARTPLADFNYNRWGGSAGGPVRIPGLYNGKDRTFFMFGYEGIKEARPRNNGTPTVPTAAMKKGDFSQMLAIGPTYQLYNPFTRVKEGSRFRAQPFTGNVIPSNLINPVAAKILTYYPDPLQAGLSDGSNNYLRSDLLETAKYNSYTIRIDHSLSSRHKIFGRTSWYDRDSDYNDFFDNISTGTIFRFLSRSGVVDYVGTLSSTTVVNLRYGYNRFIRAQDMRPDGYGFDLTQLGFPAAYNSAIPSATRRFPRIDLSGYQGTGQTNEWRPNDIHSINATMNKAMSTHSFKAGTEFRSYRETDSFASNDMTGRYNFDNTYTKGPLDNATAPSQLGFSVAALLLGIPASSNSYVARTANYAEQSTSWGFFAHDDWRATSRLTLNIGLRWEFEQPMTERFDRSVTGFDFSVVQPFEAAARAAYAANPTPEVAAADFKTRGGLLFVGQNGLDGGLYKTPKVNLMPRFGFAYKLGDAGKIVIRGGYGAFFGFLGQRRGDVVQAGYSQNTPFIPTSDGINFIGTLTNPFPNGITEPVGAAAGTATFVGQAVTFFHQEPQQSQMHRWQLGIQHELKGGWVAEATYVGNKGYHIEYSRNLNATPNQYLSTSPVRDQTKINYLSANMTNPLRGLLPSTAISGLSGTAITRERLLRPYPQFDSVNTTDYNGYSWYHALQTRLDKRFSKGYTFGMNWTWSKYMQATELLNGGDLFPVEVISDYDRPHRVTASGIYELPFGRGRTYAGGVHPALNALIGGWQVSGIYTYQSGSPLSWGNILYYGNIEDIVLPSDQRTLGKWFNTSAPFEKDSTKQLGSNVRTFPLRFSSLRSHETNNWDMSVIKKTLVREGKYAEFRAEFLNAFNHVLLPAPNTTPTAVAFGTISASNQANYPRRIQMSLKFIF